DVLVNNAGILLDRQPGEDWVSVADVPIDDVRKSLEVNTIGALRMIQAVLPLMRSEGYGRIVNMSSGLGQMASIGVGSPGYRMSKAALNVLTLTLAAELGDGPIKVNSASPGWVQTEMGGENATRTVEEGADTPVWLATLPDDGPTGGFFEDRKRIPW
ncbi:MAG: SDR family NAD(P)-dependent oxidoreductase, partial [Pseudomonadota bacterium]